MGTAETFETKAEAAMLRTQRDQAIAKVESNESNSALQIGLGAAIGAVVVLGAGMAYRLTTKSQGASNTATKELAIESAAAQKRATAARVRSSPAVSRRA